MDAPTIRILPTTPEHVMSEAEVRAYYEAMLKAPKRVIPPKRFNDKGEEQDEDGEPIRYTIDPPHYYVLHYTEVACTHRRYAEDWSWSILVAAMPALIAAGHEGKSAVVTRDCIAVAEKWSDAQAEWRRAGGGNSARIYTIRERVTFGRTYSRMRRVCKPTPPLPPMDEATAKACIYAILSGQRRERDGVA